MNLLPYIEQKTLTDQINFSLHDPAFGNQIVGGQALKTLSIKAYICPDSNHQRFSSATPAIAFSNYAGCIGSQQMEASGKTCVMASIVGNGGPNFDDDDDGEDWFSYTSKGRTCNGAGPGNTRSDCPFPDRISGPFGRSTWAARFRGNHRRHVQCDRHGRNPRLVLRLSIQQRLVAARRPMVCHHRADQHADLPGRKRRPAEPGHRRQRLPIGAKRLERDDGL